MATLTRAALSAVLNLVYQDDIVDQFRRDVVLANLLTVRNGRNDACTWPVKFRGRSAGGAYAEGADMEDEDFDSHDRKQAMLPWAQYRTGAKISGLAQAIASASGGGVSADVTDEELRDAIDELAILVGAGFYSGNPGASPVELAGAALAIDDNDGANFAAIDPTDYGDWLASEETLAAEDVSISNIRKLLFRPVKDAVGMDPEFVTCPGGVIDLLKDVLGEKAPTVQQVRTTRGVIDITAATGMKAISIDGVPFIEDRHCTASTCYSWHSRYVEVRQVPATKARVDPNTVIQALKALTGVDVSVDEVEARLRANANAMVPTIEALAQTGDATKYQVKWYGQLAWKRRNAFSKLILT